MSHILTACRKRQLPSRLSPYSASKSSKIRSNSALILENIKQEIESLGADHSEGTPAKAHYALKRRSSINTHGISEVDVASDSIRLSGNHSLKNCKHEDDALMDGGDTTFTLFAPLLDSALQGLMPIPDLILQLEEVCRNVSKSIRYGNERHRIVEDKLMWQKARLLLDEAASWSPVVSIWKRQLSRTLLSMN